MKDSSNRFQPIQAIRLAIILSLSCFCVHTSTSTCEANSILSSSQSLSQLSSLSTPFHRSNNSDNLIASTSTVLDIRGGASKRRKKSGRTGSLSSLNSSSSSSKAKTATGKTKVGARSKTETSTLENALSKYKAVQPLTRVYITLVTLSTLIGTILGDEAAQALLALDPIRTIYGMELWRPITAASFLGPPSISWLMSAYYLFEYGSQLERVYGTAQHFVFLTGQVFFLTLTSLLFAQPFFAQSVITAMLHVLSRSMPHQKVKWLIFTVPYWSLPYGLMASDVLQAGSAAAALPHVMGILSGHFYYFHKFVWPKLGGEDWLSAPDFLRRRLDPMYAEADGGRKSLENALKKRKKGKGRKLGA